MVKTLLLGLGNPILKDDSVGLKVVRELGEKVAEKDVHIEEASFANIDILEAIGPYDRLSLDDLQSTLHLSCPHDINLATAFELGKRLGMHVPREIRIYAIEIEDNQTFSETCSPSVERAIPRIVKEIAKAEHFENREMNSLTANRRLQISD
jgi:hydrogenase maturation protease